MKEKQKTNKVQTQESEVLIKQLNRDVRDSILVVSLLVNAYILVGWLVIQVSTTYDAALINYLQTR